MDQRAQGGSKPVASMSKRERQRALWRRIGILSLALFCLCIPVALSIAVLAALRKYGVIEAAFDLKQAGVSVTAAGAVGAFLFLSRAFNNRLRDWITFFSTFLVLVVSVTVGMQLFIDRSRVDAKVLAEASGRLTRSEESNRELIAAQERLSASAKTLAAQLRELKGEQKDQLERLSKERDKAEAERRTAEQKVEAMAQTGLDTVRLLEQKEQHVVELQKADQLHGQQLTFHRSLLLGFHAHDRAAVSAYANLLAEERLLKDPLYRDAVRELRSSLKDTQKSASTFLGMVLRGDIWHIQDEAKAVVQPMTQMLDQVEKSRMAIKQIKGRVEEASFLDKEQKANLTSEWSDVGSDLDDAVSDIKAALDTIRAR